MEQKTDYSRMFKSILTKLFGVIGAGIFLYLTIYSFRYTEYFPSQYSEILAVKQDQALLHLLSLVLLVAGCRFLTRFRGDKNRKYGLILVMVLTFAQALIWVLISGLSPCADQQSVFQAAVDVLHGRYDYFHADGYFGSVKFQMELGAVFQFFLVLFRSEHYLVLQIVNACCVPAIVYAGDRIVRIAFDEEKTEIYYLTAMLFCFPLIFYTPFVYGEELSVLSGFLMVWMLLEVIRRKRNICMLPGAFAAVIAIFTKGSSWIIVIASVIILVLYACRQKRVQLLLAAFLIVAVPILSGNLLTAANRRLSGSALDQGIPAIAWIAMGTNTDDVIRAGWYNGYNFNTYAACGFDRQKTMQASEETIRQSAAEFRANPHLLLRFLKNKSLSQWNVPDYECLASNSNFTEKPTGFVKSIYEAGAGKALAIFLNEYQWLLYLGILAGCVCAFRGRDAFFQNLLLLILIGSFLFSLLWEAKTRYEFPVLLYMIPYAAYGWEKMYAGMQKWLCAVKVALSEETFAKE